MTTGTTFEGSGYYLIDLKSLSDNDWLSFLVPLDEYAGLDEHALALSVLNDTFRSPEASKLPGLFRGVWNNYNELGEIAGLVDGPDGRTRLHLVWASDLSLSVTDFLTIRAVSVGSRVAFWEGPTPDTTKYDFVVTHMRKIG